ncbi:MAG TPA: TonB-dependent receptor [Taishania sp.]|nr:TonB-dependent receptor [Taishania sp.]
MRIYISAILVALCHVISAQVFEGRVLDVHTREGIPFAQVSVHDYHLSVSCDEEGKFALHGKFPEQIRVTVSASGYDRITEVIKLVNKLELFLEELHLDFDEVLVTASGNELKRNAISYVELKSIKELNELPKISMGHMLEVIPGVYNASTGPGISKPVIRGFQGIRVLTFLNGIRMEGQQWGGDHGLGISELGIGSVEVLKGPASLAYGADALGGVLYLSNEGYADQFKHNINFSSLFESNTMGSVNSLLYKGSTKNVKYMIGGRFASHADYQLASKAFVRNSRFQDQNLKFSMGWHKGKWVGNVRYDFSHSSLGIPGHTHDSIATAVSFLSDEQVRKFSIPIQYLDNHVASFENKLVFDKHIAQILVGYSLNQLIEHDEKVTIPELFLSTHAIPYKVNLTSKVGTNVDLQYGWQGLYLQQNNNAKAMDRLVPDANQLDNGLYFTSVWTKKRLRVLAGVRGDVRTLKSMQDVKFTDALSIAYGGFNFSWGMSVNFNKNHVLRTNITSGFRTPHLSELMSNGVHHGSFRYEVGNRDLKSEKALQLDLAYEFVGEHLSVVLNPFFNGIIDFVYLSPQGFTIDGLPVFNYEQSKSSVLQAGADVGVHYHPHFAHILHIESSFSYLDLFSSNTSVYSFIPQPRWSNTLSTRFEMKSKVKVNNVILQLNYFLPQTKVAQFETMSVDYATVDLGTQLSFGKSNLVSLQIGARNIFNKQYTNHLSRLKNIGVSNSGRSFYIKLLANLNF